jgi:hypothetical protein
MKRTIIFVIIFMLIGFVLGYLIFGRISGEYVGLKAIFFNWVRKPICDFQPPHDYTLQCISDQKS